MLPMAEGLIVLWQGEVDAAGVFAPKPPDPEPPDPGDPSGLFYNGTELHPIGTRDRMVLLGAFNIADAVGALEYEVTGSGELAVTFDGVEYQVLIAVIRGTGNLALLGQPSGKASDITNLLPAEEE
jgi:hypothetical protein